MGNLIANIACGFSSTNDTIFGQWFMRRRFLNVFAIKTYIKQCSLRAWPFMTPGTSIEHLAPRMFHAKYQRIPVSDS